MIICMHYIIHNLWMLFLLQREVIPLTQTGRLKSSQQTFLSNTSTISRNLHPCWSRLRAPVLPSLLYCSSSGAPPLGMLRDCQTWFCGHILYSEVTLRRRVVGKPVTGIRWQQPKDGTTYRVIEFSGKVRWNPFCLSKDIFIFFNSQFVKTKYPYMEINREQLLGE